MTAQDIATHNAERLGAGADSAQVADCGNPCELPCPIRTGCKKHRLSAEKVVRARAAMLAKAERQSKDADGPTPKRHTDLVPAPILDKTN